MTNKLILQSLTAQAADIDHIAALVGAHAHRIGTHVWRCENIILSDTKKLHAACKQANTDYALLPTNTHLHDFKLLAIDMDSTLITIECIDEIADMQGLKPQVAALTEATMRGELEFSQSLKQRVALLKGLDVSVLEQIYQERIQFSLGAERMLAGVKAAGIKTLLVSGGFTFFTERLKTALGFDYAQANELEIIEGKLTGQLRGTIIGAIEKKQAVENICTMLGITTQQAIAIGDGANDLHMMHIAGLSVAFRAKPIVSQQASISLNFVGLDGILPILA